LKDYVYADCDLTFNEELELWEIFDWKGAKVGEAVSLKQVYDMLRSMKLKGEGPWKK